MQIPTLNSKSVTHPPHIPRNFYCERHLPPPPIHQGSQTQPASHASQLQLTLTSVMRPTNSAPPQLALPWDSGPGASPSLGPHTANMAPTGAADAPGAGPHRACYLSLKEILGSILTDWVYQVAGQQELYLSLLE